MELKVKKCCDCKNELPISMFWKNKSTYDGYQSVCKECSKKRYKNFIIDNPEKTREYSKKHWWKYRDEKIKGDRVRMDNRQIFIDSLKTHCVKCGEKRPYVIQFHHKDPTTKQFTIGESSKYHKSKDDVINECKKCVCLCCNCHKEYHYLYGIKPSEPIKTLNDYLEREDVQYGSFQGVRSDQK